MNRTLTTLLLIVASALLTIPAFSFELYVEAEDGKLDDPMQAVRDPTAGADACVVSSISDRGADAITFDLPVAGTYYFWVRVQTSTRSSDAIWFAMEGEESSAHRFFTSRFMSTYDWFRVHDRHADYAPSLAAGTHTLTFTTAEAGFRLDTLYITDAPGNLPTGFVPPESCADGIRNQDEQDVDCGGRACPSCPSGRACSAPSGCRSGVCAGHVCQVPSCTDGMRNGKERGIDCGGSCGRPCKPPVLHDLLPLVGDPTFDRDRLAPEVRTWHDRAVESMRASAGTIEGKARSGDLFPLGRHLNVFTQDLMLAFRATGDLRFLDRGVELWEMARVDLSDAWCDGTKDGYLNWLWLEDARSRAHYCKDVHVMDEAMTHGGLAMFAYALDRNRDLGPGYGAKADFWIDYLEKHFLAKWYARAAERGCNEVEAWEKEGCGFYKRFTHPRTNQLRLAYYLWKITGKMFYRERATVVAGELSSKVEPVPSTPGANRWKHQVSGGDVGYQGINYAQYYMRGLQEMYLEQFDVYAGDDVMTRYMSTFRDVVFDATRFGPRHGMMADRVDGSGSRGFNMYGLDALARWDSTGFLLKLAARKYKPGVDGMHLAAGALAAVSNRGAACTDRQ